MGTQRIIAEHPGRSISDRYKDPSEIVFLPLPRAEPQKVVETIRSAAKTRSLMTAGIKRFDYDSGSDWTALSPGIDDSGPVIANRVPSLRRRRRWLIKRF